MTNRTGFGKLHQLDDSDGLKAEGILSYVWGYMSISNSRQAEAGLTVQSQPGLPGEDAATKTTKA